MTSEMDVYILLFAKIEQNPRGGASNEIICQRK